MNIILEILWESWLTLQKSSLYMLFGILVAGLLRVFLRPESVSRHLGAGRFKPVFKAALLGIPMPLCSCGVLPAATMLKKQGANNGAITSFLISTPESDIDAIVLTYALIDPVMTVARPVAGFATALGAGVAENLVGQEESGEKAPPDLSCPVDRCCDGVGCLPEAHRRHHSFAEKLRAGMSYALGELWDDIALWFFAGVLIAGLITALMPPGVMERYLGGGLLSMLIMLFAAMPLYICASASTPIAAALILKGVSPGAALVFLLAGPATNITSMTVLVKILGKKGVAIYLGSIAAFTLASGLLLDWVYGYLGISAQAMIGQTSEFTPAWLEIGGGLVLIAISVKPFMRAARCRLQRLKGAEEVSCRCGPDACSPESAPVEACGCSVTAPTCGCSITPSLSRPPTHSGS